MKEILSIYQYTLIYMMILLYMIANIDIPSFSRMEKRMCLVLYMKTSNPSQFHAIFHSNHKNAEKDPTELLTFREIEPQLEFNWHKTQH